MSNTTLAIKYRPTEFSDVVGQSITIDILEKQLKTESFSHALLFSGSAGTGKTTCAKIFANKLDAQIIEIDSASHNGVSDIKEIIESAKVYTFNNKYKVIIFDEAHTITAAAWSSFLIALENIPTHVIYIFCTTDAHKIPTTILSRLQRFNFIPISQELIVNKLLTICKQEQIHGKRSALEYIARQSNGNLRQAIAYLEKCAQEENITQDIVAKILNIVSDSQLQKITEQLSNKDIAVIQSIEDIYANGYDMKIFIRTYLDYLINDSYSNVSTEKIELIKLVLDINEVIKYDDYPKNIIIGKLLVFIGVVK